MDTGHWSEISKSCAYFKEIAKAHILLTHKEATKRKKCFQKQPLADVL